MTEKADRDRLWDLIKNTRFCMCVQIQQADGQLHSRPLTTQNQSLDENVLYFFIPKDGDIAQNLQHDRRINLAYANVDKDSYVSISGEGQLRDDAAKKEALFNSFAKAWFPGGPTDPNLGLLAVQLQDAEYWDTKESKMMQLFKIMKANLTGTTPDLGEHGQVSSTGR